MVKNLSSKTDLKMKGCVLLSIFVFTLITSFIGGLERRPYGPLMCRQQCVGSARFKSCRFHVFSLTCNLLERWSTGAATKRHIMSENSTKKGAANCSSRSINTRTTDGPETKNPNARTGRGIILKFSNGFVVYYPEKNSSTKLTKVHTRYYFIDICYFFKNTIVIATRMYVFKFVYDVNMSAVGDHTKISTAMCTEDVTEGERDGVVYVTGRPKQPGKQRSCIWRLEQPKTVTEFYDCKSRNTDKIRVSGKHVYLYNKYKLYILNLQGELLNKGMRVKKPFLFSVDRENDVLYFHDSVHVRKMHFSCNITLEDVYSSHKRLYSMIYVNNVLYFNIEVFKRSHHLQKFVFTDNTFTTMFIYNDGFRFD